MGEVKERQKAAFFRSWLLEGILGFLSKKNDLFVDQNEWEQAYLSVGTE
ncbi:MAG TPA: hypothetical protein GXZ98_09780 [Firmicutes bacterium]|jgi:hypothetical protein|nr:hypothetical protein [Bacillota bacterium]